MSSSSPRQAIKPILALRNATKIVVEGSNYSFPAFKNLSLDVFPGERLAFFAVNKAESQALVSCLSGVEPLDAGRLEQRGSISWPVGTNGAFSGKLSGYINARFAAEVYSQPGQIEADLQRIQAMADVPDQLFHQPFGEWPGFKKDALKLAVSLAFDFDVTTVLTIGAWNHRSPYPRDVMIRERFEGLIEGRTLVVCANGQNGFAMDYCDEGLALVQGGLVYRGDPEVCLQLVRDESQRLKQERRKRVDKRVALLLDSSVEGSEDPDGHDAGIDPAEDVGAAADELFVGPARSGSDRVR